MTARLLTLLAAVLSPAAAQTNVLTYHNDNARTGQYLNEILLAPSNVKTGLFGKRFFLLADGAVYAQPLYVSRVNVAGKGFHNVVIVATAHDSVYAFDAFTGSGIVTQPLWKVSFIDPAHGVTTVPAADVGCGVIPELGISGTPVIDASSGTIYLIAETKESGSRYVFRLHALDVTSGAERPGSPVEIQPPGFVPLTHKQRGALLLANGLIYSSWSGHCDLGSYHGWVLAHNAGTLKLAAVFNNTPNGNGGSFWNGGAGPAADADGNIYLVSANGDFDADSHGSNYGESVIKLSQQLAITDFFAPFNTTNLNLLDLDLGSSGALLLPDQSGSPAHRQLLFTSGKEGRLYLLDRQNLGGAQVGSDSGAVASLDFSNHATFGSAAYFNGSVYIAPENSAMLAFPVAGAVLASLPVAQTPDTAGDHGATPSISANGDQNGIVWIVSVEDAGKLRAYDARDLTRIYDSNAQPADALYNYAEFVAPTIADGKVYVGTFYGVAVYGQTGAAQAVINAVTNAASYATDALSPGSLITLFGTDLAPVTARARATPLPLSIADVSVTVNGLAAPLLYLSPLQINAQVPFAVSPGPTKIVVRVNGTLSAPLDISVRQAAPGIFTDLDGQAAALNRDNSRNSPQNPAAVGSVVSLYFTGQGPLAVPVDDGAPAPIGPVIHAMLEASATVGGVPAEIQFAGLAPGCAGLAQMNLKVPPLPAGIYPVIVKMGGVASNAARLSVRSGS
ncbi:MAG: hypothetical protein DMG57_37285 [Acidobacteria bacterium]|nr:MAG: hypothetical protein DMG57_37285 [Acidobacteriota bacterium]